ncbi:enoyl-CoA hydratase/isomerase family protein [Streptomyces sp. NPDC006602]|uniref:enoyl-CoA hydratase/isomerase family protein n=1 Tax=Streptomyces sp. NPDC006602 TaxID=3364751 RepID=UPI003678ED11
MVPGSRGVRFETDGTVGRVVLDRPEAANAFDLPAARALGEAVTAAESPTVRAVTVTGEGKRFCAGGDVASFVATTDRPSYLQNLATELEAQLRRLAALPKPVVAGVHGAVAGAGLAFMLNSDLVVAGRSTKFAFAYPGIGLTPDCGVSYLLPRAVGQQRALELALSGRVLAADEACAWGLVSEVVDDEQVAPRTGELAARLANGPMLAFGAAKRLIRDSWEVSRADNAEDEARTIARAVANDEAERLIKEFLSR